MSRASLGNRITALVKAIKPPPNSLEAKIERFSPDDRTAYLQHRDRVAAWMRRNLNRNYYEAMLADEAPVMPKGLSEKLSGPSPIITPDMSEADAAEAYNRYRIGG